ncbi:zinc finger protein [Macleaya cordata]|uniref:Zinc finger protein n=1 Tax=Macleaya cordata TaxID=56857 RepID=A0A200R2D6_MACCD|nr:zinc finger protein [Macleaya cordata]
MENDSDQKEFVMTEQPSLTFDFDISSSPNKRLNTLTQSPTFTSKGKEKIEEDENQEEVEEEAMDSDSDNKICGICFSEDGKAIRGSIDSCNHYFCFVCIMEWAKVESRCPMCKQRFNTIIRPPKDGVFLHERVVNIPIRDQVWHPLGNMTSGPSDPYAQVNCSECHSSVDENLLLLCDLCDSAAHTYCIGLEAVPEGDWYCQDCTVSRDNHSNTQLDTDFYDHDSPSSDTTWVAGASVSISEIVKESYLPEVDRPPGGTSLHSNQLSPPAVPKRKISSRTRVTKPIVRNIRRCSDVKSKPSPPAVPVRGISIGPKVTDPSVRTLRRCRDVQSHIQAFREGWNALRSGSLGFSSNLSDSGSKNSKKPNSRAVVHEKESQPQSSSCLQNTTRENIAGDTLYKKIYDTDRAWKMLDIANSVKRAREGNNTTHQVSNNLSGTRNKPREATVTSSNVSTSKIKLFQQKDRGGFLSEKNCRCHSSGTAQINPKFQTIEKEKLSMHAMKESLNFHKGHPSTTHPSGYCKFASPKQVQRLVQVDAHHENGEKFPMQGRGTSSDVINGRVGIASSVSLGESSLGTSEPSYRRSEYRASSGCKAEPSKGKVGSEKSSANVMARKDNDAKSEVQSLVKLNLKLLSKDKQLGVTGFKEVARLATHTILAACGLEHSKSSVRPFPHSVCRHNDQNHQLRMSNLMPSSCRECFYVFVKDVVSSILTEKVTLATSNS